MNPNMNYISKGMPTFACLSFLIIYISVFVMSAQATVDDDSSLEFYWDPPATGVVDHYKVRIYESTNGGDSYYLKSEESTKSNVKTYTKNSPYKLSINAQHGDLYMIEVAGVDRAGNTGPWSEKSDPVLCYLSTQPVTIDLKPLWKFISFPVQPNNPNPQNVFSSISGKYNVVWYLADAKNNIWKRYFAAPGYTSNLLTIEAGKGYWVDMKSSASLIINDWRILSRAEVPVNLVNGRNDVGYNSLQLQTIDKAFLSIKNKHGYIYVYDKVGQAWQLIYGPNYGNTTGKMSPGSAYLIYAIENKCVWDIGNYDQPMAPSLNRTPYNIAAGNFPPDALTMPYSIWGTVKANDINMTQDDNCIVMLKIDGKIHSSCRLEGNQYGDFYTLDAPGKIDSTKKMELYVQIGDDVVNAGTILSGRPGEIRRMDLAVQTIPKVNILKQNYPNPFNPETWIPYQLKQDSNIEISIYNSVGQIIRILDLGYKRAGFYFDQNKAAYWDGKNETGEYVSSGIYFYSIKAGDFRSTRKMVVIQ